MAINSVTDLNWGTVPFQELGFIGGSRRMRGYFEGRFRDKKMYTLQAEWRQRIYKMIGMTAFVGVGSVAPEISDFIDRKVHMAFGTGLRIRVSKKDNINIRLDAGFNEDFNFRPYLTIGEAF